MADPDLRAERAPRHRPRRDRPGGSSATNVPPSSSMCVVSRSSRRPSTIVLDAGSMRDTYRGSPIATPMPFRWPTVNPAAPPCSPTRSPSASRTGPACGRPAAPRAQLLAVVAAGHEADLLALGLVRRDQLQAAGDRAHLGLREVAQREAAVPQLVLAQAVEEVRLVLVLVGGAGEAGPRPVRRCPRRRAVRSGRSPPPRTRTGGGRGRAAPRTSRTCCSRRTGWGFGRRGTPRRTAR